MNTATNEKWLTTREAAATLKISCRAVKQNAAKGKYTTKQGTTPNGQQGYLIALSSLPVVAAIPAATALADKADILAGCSEKHKAEAFRRLDALQRWDKFARQTGRGQHEAAEDFCSLALGNETSRTTLYRWKRDFQAHGIAGLIPNWGNGKGAFDEALFQSEAKQRAQQLYLSPARPSCAAVFHLVAKEAALKGWQIPSYDTVKRFLQEIPAAARILLREGKKACDDKALPAILRTMDDLRAMEIIESDHHQMDVAVVDKAGNVFFPWLTIWFDVRARRPLGWILSSTPNSDGIRIAFMKTLMEYGVPLAVHIDNGKDYRAKVFRGERGRFKLEEVRIQNDLQPSLIEGIYGSLGIKVHWAIPYNAKTKVIERFFRTLRTEFSVWFRGYRGKNTMEKPEILSRQRREKDVYAFDDFKLAVEKWVEVEYSQNREHQGLDARTPNQVFAETRIEKRVIGDEEMLWLCSEHPRKLKVGRNGIYFMNDYYWSEKLACEFLGENILVRYNDNDLSRIFVTDEAGRFIGFAEKRNPGTWNMEAADYQKHLRMKKAVRESTMPYVEIAKSLPPAEREQLFVGLIKDDGARLPAAPERRVATPFTFPLEEEKKSREEARQVEARAQEILHHYATADMPARESDRERLDRNVDEFLASYRRH
jgi:transposase InsO family protein